MERKSLSEVVTGGIGAALAGVHVALPGRVVTFYGDTQTVDVEVAVQVPAASADQEGALEWDSIPTLAGVPVCYPSGGGFSLVFPLAPGDPVMLVFSDVATGEWFDSDGAGTVRPLDSRRHSAGYPVAFPGARPTSKAAPAPGSALVLGKEGMDQRILIDAEIKLGAAAASFAAKADLVLARLEAMKTTFDAHTHPAPGGATSPTSTPMTSPASVAATLVKVQ